MISNANGAVQVPVAIGFQDRYVDDDDSAANGQPQRREQ